MPAHFNIPVKAAAAKNRSRCRFQMQYALGHFLTFSSDAINLPSGADLRISLRALDKSG